MVEEFRDIKGYEGYYKVSNLGRVKSLKRLYVLKDTILKAGNAHNGYLLVILQKDGKRKTRTIHQLVAESFLGHKPCGNTLVVNHKNFIRTDNSVSNLEIVSNRENVNQKHMKSTSKYVGVCWFESSKKWRADIHYNGKQRYLGLFDTETEASQAYQDRLKTIL